MILFVESGGWFHSFEGYINWICSADSCTLCIAASAVTVNCNAQGQLERAAGMGRSTAEQADWSDGLIVGPKNGLFSMF